MNSGSEYINCILFNNVDDLYSYESVNITDKGYFLLFLCVAYLSNNAN